MLKRLIPVVFLCLLVSQCQQRTARTSTVADPGTPETSLLESYVHAANPAYSYEKQGEIEGKGFTTHIIRLVSGEWLSSEHVKDPTWWHWITLTVPEGVTASTAMIFVGGGSRTREKPDKVDQMATQIALQSQSMVATLHNVPNQPTEFVGDDYGPRVEDELIAYGWRKFLEGGAQIQDAEWLARFPMTRAVVKAMDALQDFTASSSELVDIEDFVITGASKRGWTTWTVGAVDERVVAIAPIVIDLLNVIPSFEHHWRVYGFWAPAVGNYVQEGIMEWQNSEEYKKLVALTEPYEFRHQLDLPKLILNSTGDQFFLPDSWKFYWDDLKGEKHMRYVPNTDHSMRDSDVIETLISFHQHILADRSRPTFEWSVADGHFKIKTSPQHVPTAITLWRAENSEVRDFRIETQGKLYQPSEIPIQADGSYSVPILTPTSGYAASYVELTFPGIGDIPFKLSTGIVITPDNYDHQPYRSPDPRGTLPGGR